jgi:hypothetical protein
VKAASNTKCGNLPLGATLFIGEVKCDHYRTPRGKKTRVAWAESKSVLDSSKIMPSLNRKATGTARSPKPQPLPIERLKAGAFSV